MRGQPISGLWRSVLARNALGDIFSTPNLRLGDTASEPKRCSTQPERSFILSRLPPNPIFFSSDHLSLFLALFFALPLLYSLSVFK
jgi:hypothetical protein